jgi:glutamine amidotransferase-like uncharacterized protein
MICETTWQDDPKGKDKDKHQPFAVRIRQHRVIVHCLLKHLEMIECNVDCMLPDQKPGDPIRMAVYNGGGTGNKAYLNLEKIFSKHEDVIMRPVGPVEICAGALEQFDLVYFPGGSGSKQAAAIGETGRKRVVDFVKNGGGYVGVCAGAYLASSNYSWSLRIIDTKVIDRAHWKRGTGVIKMEMTPEGLKMLGGRKMMDIYYANGPLMAPAEKEELPDYTALAFYRTEIAKNDAPEGVMINTPSIVTALFGRGRVFVFGPHPEKDQSEEGAEVLIIRAVKACAKPEPAALKKAS